MEKSEYKELLSNSISETSHYREAGDIKCKKKSFPLPIAFKHYGIK